MSGLRRWLWPLLLAAAACNPPSLSARYGILDEQPDGAPASLRVLLVADSHHHHLYGQPYWLRTDLAEKIVNVTIRPVQLDLFGHDLLRWALQHRGDRIPAIHLGDAMDVSCGAELDRFLGEVALTRQPWAHTPGNHDGYFSGVVGRDGDWEGACKDGGGPVDKARFVARYLRALADQGRDPGARALLAERLDHGVTPPTGEWRYRGSERAFLRRVAWAIHPAEPWRSFVAQEVDLSFPGEGVTPSLALLLDTAQYADAPSLPLSTANDGSILADQRATVLRWAGEDSAARTIVIGHHPFDALSAEAQRLVDELRVRHRALLYVSAHTHAGRYYVHESHPGSWLELNLGSVLDWPPELRTLELLQRRKDGRVAALLPRTLLADELTAFGEIPLHCEPAWEARPGDPDDYIGYQDLASPSAATSETRLDDVLLAAYRRLLLATPTRTSPPSSRSFADDAAALAAIEKARASTSRDDKVRALVDLEAFESARVPVDAAKHEAYRLCQALWASREMNKRSRRPRPSDWVIVFPRE